MWDERSCLVLQEEKHVSDCMVSGGCPHGGDYVVSHYCCLSFEKRKADGSSNVYVNASSALQMSYLLPHLHTGFAVDQAILSVSCSPPLY